MNTKNQKLWSSTKYYEDAKRGSEDLSHPGMKLLIKLCLNSKRVLDLGCGEGTRLNLVTTSKNEKVGLDISSKAVEIARKKYPNSRFVRGDFENLPFKTGEFDLVFSAYVLEHLTDVKKSIEEAIRVSNKHLVLICPNYGSPNRASPNYLGSRLIKLIKGYIQDYTFDDVNSWNKVTPQKSFLYKNYHIDDDTTIEPYMHSLLNFLTKNNMNIIYWDTCWEYELPRAFMHQKIIRYLAKKNISPFKYWGPHIVVYAKKD